LTEWVFCRDGPKAGLVLRCEDLSDGMVTFDAARGTLAVYLVTDQMSRIGNGSVPVAEFLGEHELR
jgi:hypothetical protein